MSQYVAIRRNASQYVVVPRCQTTTQHIATHCDTLRQGSNILRHHASPKRLSQTNPTYCDTLRHPTHCDTLNPTHCCTLRHICNSHPTVPNALRHIAAPDTLRQHHTQRIATYCNALRRALLPEGGPSGRRPFGKEGSPSAHESGRIFKRFS